MQNVMSVGVNVCGHFYSLASHSLNWEKTAFDFGAHVFDDDAAEKRRRVSFFSCLSHEA
jgi:hypothetical protein